MSGGGGGYIGASSLEDLRSQVRDSEAESRDQTFQGESSELISSVLTELNNRDTERINADLEQIKQALAEEIDGTVDLRFGGSVAKHTYVDGLSDVDALVLLDKSELKGKSPEDAKAYFVQQLQKRLPPGTPVEAGTLAVTVNLGSVDLQLLPAIKYRSGFRIADPSGEVWSLIHPRKFSSLLTEINQNTGGRVVPTIKLAKSIIGDFAEDRRLNGYHIEALAVEVFKRYEGPKTTKAMLVHFFSEASKFVRTPLRDVTSQSVYVDEYLGGKTSKRRQFVSDSLSQVGRRMEKADNAQSLGEWKTILGIN
ncbi:MAG: hypothetical protein QOF72_3000 [Blastocatellia bacterium]|jgi:hypothetical protein|nr:hypothetical protein [Blastocatellia bacterium]